MDDAFLRFLDKMDEEQKREKALNARRVDEFSDPTHARAHAVDVEIVEGASDVSSDARAGPMVEIQQVRDKEPSDG
jgi:hypothetical protein